MRSHEAAATTSTGLHDRRTADRRSDRRDGVHRPRRLDDPGRAGQEHFEGTARRLHAGRHRTQEPAAGPDLHPPPRRSLLHPARARGQRVRHPLRRHGSRRHPDLQPSASGLPRDRLQRRRRGVRDRLPDRRRRMGPGALAATRRHAGPLSDGRRGCDSHRRRRGRHEHRSMGRRPVGGELGLRLRRPSPCTTHLPDGQRPSAGRTGVGRTHCTPADHRPPGTGPTPR